MRQRIRDRAAMLAKLIETDPSAAVALALPEDTRAAIAATYPDEPVESSGTWEGEGQELVEDDFSHGVSRTRYTVLLDGQQVSAFFAGETPRFQCGRKVSVTGLRLGGRIAVTAVTTGLQLTSCSTVGQQKIAVLIVSYPGVPNTVSQSVVQSAFFGSGRALSNYWSEASYGSTSATGGVFGPFVLDKTYLCTTQTSQMLTAAISAADSTVDFRNYTRLFIFYPIDPNCVGLGTVGCQTNFSPSKGSFASSVAWIGVDSTSTNDYIVDVSAHEGGHGLGLQHASSYAYPGEALGAPSATPVFSEYGDLYSAMGITYTVGTQTIIAQYGAPHKQLLGWLGGSNVQTVTSSGIYTLLPYETGSGLKAIRVQRGSTDKYLWLEYRQSLGNYDTLFSLISGNIFNGLLIHYEDPDDLAHSGHTELLDFNPQTYQDVSDAVLVSGRTWSDPYTNLSITVNSANAGGATVSVQYNANCSSITPTSRSHGAGPETGTVAVSAPGNCSWTAQPSDPWIGISSGGSGAGNGTVGYSVNANVSTAGRAGSINISGNVFGITQAGCTFVLTNTSYSATASAGSTSFTIITPCAWTASSSDVWLTASLGGGTGNFTQTINFSANPGPSSRIGTITVGNQTFTVTQPAPTVACTYVLPLSSFNAAASGGGGVFLVNANCPWSAVSNVAWITIAGGTAPGNGIFSVSVSANTGPARSTVIAVGTATLTISQAAATVSAGLRFIPVTPCRVADTRSGQGTSGAFGPPSMSAGSMRDFPIPASPCGIPASAQAYSLNITVVPPGPLAFLTVWPSGQSRPLVSTLNSPAGDIVANAAIVPAGSNGAVSVFSTNNTDLVIDINGYFAPATFTPPAGSSSLAFFAATPCRVADTRAGQGTSGAFGPPTMAAGTSRDFPIPSSTCGIPAAAKAYSLNVTVVPSGSLAFLSAWPAGTARPVVSTLNSAKGKIVANAAIIPAGTNGAVSVFVTNNTDVIVDINGYFADPSYVPPTGNALLFYPITPCRVADTRAGQGTSGPFGPPNVGGGSNSRAFPVLASPCGVSATAQAYAFNITAVPPGPLSYLTAWPVGQSQPTVSTLNSPSGLIVANAAIVPAGTGGGISLFSPEPTDVILDINGYFAP